MKTKLTEQFVQEAVKNYSEDVMRMAYTYLKNGSDAQDMTQETFLALIQKNPEIEDEQHLRAWLLRVVINKCKNHLATAWLHKRKEMPEEMVMETKDDNLLKAVFSLEVRYRLPLHLYYYGGYSIKEIASIMKKPQATIGTWLRRGRELLRKELEDDQRKL